MAKNLSSKIVSVFVIFSGILNIISSFYLLDNTRFNYLKDSIPIDLLHFGRTLTVAVGFCLILIGMSMLERKRRAFLLALTLLTLSLFLNIFKGLDFEESIVDFIIIIILFINKDKFIVKSKKIEFMDILNLTLIFSFFYFLYFLQGFSLLRHSHAFRWYVGSFDTLFFIFIFIIISYIFSPLIENERAPKDRANIILDLLNKYGRNSSDFMAFGKDKKFLFYPDNKGFIFYGLSNSTAIILGGPICDAGLYQDFLLYVDKFFINNGIDPVFVNCEEQDIDPLKELGYSIIKVGKDALVELEGFTIDTPERKNVRNAISKISRSNINHEFYTMNEIPWSVMLAIQNLRKSWLERKKLPPASFSMNLFPFPDINEGYVLVTHLENGVLGSVLSFYPYNNKRSYALDLMMRGNEAPNGIMEFSFYQAIEFFGSMGVKEINLGMVMLNDEQMDPSANKLTISLAKVVQRYYGTVSLEAFKSKFSSHWSYKYLAYKNNLKIPKYLLANFQLHFSKKYNKKEIF